ncbi:hypothetical protein CEXT_306971 [Caerostris extrusa]|uniref:Uncharacterized protein n=1 Tax=Caerostris extrusa TaxID=172846 RepID=A0AAV4XSA8_CAEEX|nr:hypothetical protein CEXT_306971 [Caerostris extrusa]
MKSTLFYSKKKSIYTDAKKKKRRISAEMESKDLDIITFGTPWHHKNSHIREVSSLTPPCLSACWENSSSRSASPAIVTLPVTQGCCTQSARTGSHDR